VALAAMLRVLMVGKVGGGCGADEEWHFSVWGWLLKLEQRKEERGTDFDTWKLK